MVTVESLIDLYDGKRWIVYEKDVSGVLKIYASSSWPTTDIVKKCPMTRIVKSFRIAFSTAGLLEIFV